MESRRGRERTGEIAEPIAGLARTTAGANRTEARVARWRSNPLLSLGPRQSRDPRTRRKAQPDGSPRRSAADESGSLWRRVDDRCIQASRANRRESPRRLPLPAKGQACMAVNVDGRRAAGVCAGTSDSGTVTVAGRCATGKLTRLLVGADPRAPRNQTPSGPM